MKEKNQKTQNIDLSFLDRPEILQLVFYPRREVAKDPDVIEILVPVTESIKISCRWHFVDKNAPTVLFFHGNGEIASDYDDLAPAYNKMGLNLFVADYRGYGQSNGSPTLTAMILDAHVIFSYLRRFLEEQNYYQEIIVMGRSLGSASAIEIAFQHPQQIKGMIIESGYAHTYKLFRRLGVPSTYLPSEKEHEVSNLEKIKRVQLPTLIIHAQNDHIIPLQDGKDLYDNIATIKEEKELVIIPQADHNSILYFGFEIYFKSLKKFFLKLGVLKSSS
ncbi:MAG: alpha/beta hydrolase [Candidatus Hermodarchaeota archaeon]